MNEFTKQIEEFFKQFKLRSYKRGDVIIHEDDVPNGVYYIEEGCVKLYSYSPDGEELIRLVLGPGDLFPIRWTIDQEPIDYYLAPMTDLECYYTSRESFIEFVSKDPELFLELARYIVKRMGTLYKRMEFFAFGDAYQKLASILVYLNQRFGKETEQGLLIDLPLTQHDLGAMIGISRETVNEELDKLRAAGVIETRDHHIIIKDLQKLDENSPLITAI